MININRYTLSNGLRVIHNEDNTTQMVALNLLYDVGARDEDPDHTGFAHLFEHVRMWKPDSGWRVTVCCPSTLTRAVWKCNGKW